MILLFIFFILILFAIYYDANEFKPSASLIILWWVIFVLLSGFRYRVGGDTLNYIYEYNIIPSLIDLSFQDIMTIEYQPLWVVLFSLCKSISTDFTLFQIIHAIITNTIIFYFIKKNTKYFFTGILFYFLFYYLYFNTEILRETIAICLFLISLKYFFTKKWLLYYLLIFIAFMFHLSASILFILPLLKSTWTYKTYLIFGIITSIVFIFFSANIETILLNIIPHEGIRMLAINYLRFKINITGTIFTMVIKIFLPIFLFFISEQKLGYKSKFRPFLYVYVFISLLSLFMHPFYRLSNYFIPIYFLFFAEMINRLYRFSNFKILRSSLVLLFFFMVFSTQIYYFGRSTSDRVPKTRFYNIWYPYNTIFNKQMNEKRENLVYTYKFTQP